MLILPGQFRIGRPPPQPVDGTTRPRLQSSPFFFCRKAKEGLGMGQQHRIFSADSRWSLWSVKNLRPPKGSLSAECWERDLGNITGISRSSLTFPQESVSPPDRVREGWGKEMVKTRPRGHTERGNAKSPQSEMSGLPNETSVPLAPWEGNGSSLELVPLLPDPHRAVPGHFGNNLLS